MSLSDLSILYFIKLTDRITALRIMLFYSVSKSSECMNTKTVRQATMTSTSDFEYMAFHPRELHIYIYPLRNINKIVNKIFISEIVISARVWPGMTKRPK